MVITVFFSRPNPVTQPLEKELTAVKDIGYEKPWIIFRLILFV